MSIFSEVKKAVKKVTKVVKKAVDNPIINPIGAVTSAITGKSYSDQLKIGATAGGAIGLLSNLFGSTSASTASGASGGNSSGFLGSLFSSLTGGNSNSGSFLGGLLNTGLGLAGAYGTSIFNTEMQEKLQDKAFANNVKMWNMQNAYNTPLAQMQRYQEAGLNPNLIYGNGVSSAGNASSAPNYEPVRFHGIDLNSIMMFQQLENLNSQNRLLEAQTQQAIAQARNTSVDNQTKIINASNAQALTDADLSIKRAMARETNARAQQVEQGDNLGWKAWLRSAFLSRKKSLDARGINIVPYIKRGK